MKKKILCVIGSLNQTTMLHQISTFPADEYDFYFTPFYADGYLRVLVNMGFLNFTPMGHKGSAKLMSEKYCAENNLAIDYRGEQHNYDLVILSSDLVVPNNVRGKKTILVQEGMTDPENWMYHLVKHLGVPRYLASTSTTGLSDAYDVFCIASEGYRELFINKGVKPEKLAVTGIPNFDHCAQYYDNDFPHKNYVMVATSDARETLKYENRKKTILEAVEIANGQDMLFKLHPNENVERATAEINKWAPGAKVFSSGNTNHMIANCDVLVTQYSTVVYVGLALGKKCYSKFDMDTLIKQTPLQNGGQSAENISKICRNVIEGRPYTNLPFFHQAGSAVRKPLNNTNPSLTPSFARSSQ